MFFDKVHKVGEGGGRLHHLLGRLLFHPLAWRRPVHLHTSLVLHLVLDPQPAVLPGLRCVPGALSHLLCGHPRPALSLEVLLLHGGRLELVKTLARAALLWRFPVSAHCLLPVNELLPENRLYRRTKHSIGIKCYVSFYALFTKATTNVAKCKRQLKYLL